MHSVFLSSWLLLVSLAQVPHNQDQPPGPALSPQEAIQKMTVPEGFSVELVASEPDIVNPVAMTIDERGRFWITESLEYPRREPGPGRDRVKVLEDTDGDGKADKFTIFAEGLNIPSGVAVGHGGVWVANAPDLLFLQDTDGDGKADQQEVIVTGFGRTDTHELPNSLTWGPDGWLYGLNGVFNFSHVKYSPTNPNFKPDHPGWPLTCALFRIHPRTREFQVYCEGTSNPWGVAINDEGSFFISACVIDHLWHLVQTGYYHRQGGPYPPHTWKIESIVKHKHQKAAYCGITWFDSDAYPEQYRGKLYMGNIHGNCINSDKLQRNGSTYFATLDPDFLSANDAWFMPVVQKTGPDGCLYVLDWYDQYHCYQDANRDPAGIDRLKGRLYRVRYKNTPRAPKFNLGQDSDEALLARLGDSNVYFRETAQRILNERNTPEIKQKLTELALSDQTPAVQRRHARFAWLGCTLTGPKNTIPELELAKKFLEQKGSAERIWGIRCLVEHGLPPFRNPTVTDRSEAEESYLFEILYMGASDPDPTVRLETMIAVGLIGRGYGMPVQHIYVADYPRMVLEALGAEKSDDPLLARMAWQSLQPWLDKNADHLVKLLSEPAMPYHTDQESIPLTWPSMVEILPRIIDKLLSQPTTKPETLTRFLTQFTSGPTNNPELASLLLRRIITRSQTGELDSRLATELKAAWTPFLLKTLQQQDHPLAVDAVALATTWGMKDGYSAALAVLGSNEFSNDQRVMVLEALASAGQDELLRPVAETFEKPTPETLELRTRLLIGLGRLDDPEVAQMVLHFYPKFEPELQPKAIELLTQRANWGQQLLKLVASKKIPVDALNINQVRKLLAFKNAELTKQVTATWGTLREQRDPAREQVIRDMRHFIRSTPGDPFAGQKVFAKVCGQCHKIHGEGADVGPDITLNGRNSFDQLLSNVFDPSLVIGASYQATTVATTEGRVLTGLLVEDSPERIILKVQGGKLETIPRDQIEERKVSELSMMPEGLEKQITKQEMADLWAYLILDKPPSDKSAKILPGAR